MELYQIISTVISALTLLGLGSFMQIVIKDRHDRRKQNSDQVKKNESDKRIKEIRDVIQQELVPLKNEIERLQDTDKLQRQGLQALLRDRLYQLSVCCTKRGYTTYQDRDNFNNMYEKYHGLGLNGVMDSVKDRFFELPTEEEFLRDNNEE